MHNWWRTRALGFHQETTEESRQQQNWFCIKLYIICTRLVSFCLYGSRNVISTKLYFQRKYEIQNLKRYFQREENITNFSYEIQNPKHYFQREEITANFSYKIQNHRRYLNVSRNIII